jgi:hypothetical protein
MDVFSRAHWLMYYRLSLKLPTSAGLINIRVGIENFGRFLRSDPVKSGSKLDIRLALLILLLQLKKLLAYHQLLINLTGRAFCAASVISLPY